MDERRLLIEADAVSMRFRKYSCGASDNLKDYLIHALKGKLKSDVFLCLDSVSFRISRGESVAIIGRNGAGKSTLLKIISGILKPTSGRVQVSGALTPLLKLGAGFDMNANGLENIYLNGAILGYTKSEIASRMGEILDFAELGDFIYSPLRTYSSGMLARLGFAVAVCMEPDILLIDEILAVGDSAFQKKCYLKFDELRSKGATFIIVTHSSNISNICERALWLREGKLAADGPCREVCAQYREFLDQSEREKRIER